jgi:ribosomal protein S18 acetylase RimI-like enzyme
MAAAERWAAARGLPRITLETGACNQRARHFYEEAGYQEEEVTLTKAVAPLPERAQADLQCVIKIGS